MKQAICTEPYYLRRTSQFEIEVQRFKSGFSGCKRREVSVGFQDSRSSPPGRSIPI